MQQRGWFNLVVAIFGPTVANPKKSKPRIDNEKKPVKSTKVQGSSPHSTRSPFSTLIGIINSLLRSLFFFLILDAYAIAR